MNSSPRIYFVTHAIVGEAGVVGIGPLPLDRRLLRPAQRMWLFWDSRMRRICPSIYRDAAIGDRSENRPPTAQLGGASYSPPSTSSTSIGE